jgi:hypothetical protein
VTPEAKDEKWMQEQDEKRMQEQAIKALRKSVFTQKLHAAVTERRASAASVKDIFTEIVSASAEMSADDAALEQDALHKNFWTRMHTLTQGYLKVATANGPSHHQEQKALCLLLHQALHISDTWQSQEAHRDPYV